MAIFSVFLKKLVEFICALEKFQATDFQLLSANIIIGQLTDFKAKNCVLSLFRRQFHSESQLGTTAQLSTPR